MEEDVVVRWKKAIEEYPFSMDQIIPHGSYLMNSGSPDSGTLEKTRIAMLDECHRCERLGILAYNFHPGSTTGKCTVDECIQTIADTINYVIENTKFITLVVETMAAQGNSVGGKFEELRQIIDLVKDKSRVGVCLDTCHIFAAGYDIRTKETYEETMNEFERIVGFNYLKAVHLNDSKGDLGSKLDRHEHIGKGYLKTAFQWLMRDPRFDGIPMVLETPEGHYSQEMELLYNLEKNKENNM
uniref:Xylose isomerase-like TIM barrel domain-containing protein n=1 Tax=Acrobeloides nanus TaxID=290746 RepID=A0A914D3B5_9BILA